eukprot:gnl/MRDRNA2_/MRDRNA2_120908_c0_seq1.p1 gnl/MRDRNA2_/MRDRNA2_120908_c0~~gnl/MRDRNA2_/MRDRNA2_120908_c0_seq1.p1  ORF type:complete len:471 (-),score=65.22 gnl/MRDRNA2_/MRDRNA2_120908_c0_seq1:301-1713(-)
MAPATEHTPLNERSSQWCDSALRVRLLTVVFSIAEGYDLGVITNALSPIQSEFHLTPLTTGIFASSLWWAAMISAAFSGSVIDWIGRKAGIAVSAAVITAGNVCWALAPNVVVLLTGRIICGLGIGMGVPIVAVYMAEVAPVSKRGFYVSLEGLFIDIGIFSGMLAGALLVGVRHDWRIMVAIGGILPLISCIFALTPCLPESPRFLQATGRVDEARVVLLDLLHGNEVEVDNAFAVWAEEARSSKQGRDWRSVMSAFFSSHSQVALAGIGAGFFFMLSGITVFVTYSVLLLAKNGLSMKTAAIVMACISALKIVTYIPPTFFLMDRWGRRPLFLCSTIALSFACGFIAFGNYAGMGGIWIAIGLGIFGCSFSLGLGSCFFAYVSEVFDNSTRAKGVGCAMCVARLTGATWVLIYPLLTATLGVSATWCLLAGCNACAAVFFLFFCPETLGVPLEEINRIFQVQKQASKI